MKERALISYEPNPVLDWAYARVFERIEVDPAWVEAVRDAERRGTVVYVLRNLSFVDFFALDFLTRRHRLPRVRFANDLGLWILEPMGRGWLNALRGRERAGDAHDLTRALRSGSSAALFLKRPPRMLEPGARGQSEGDDFIRTVIDVQRTRDRPILLVPQVFVWSRHPDERARNVVDAFFGPREWPGKMRTIAQFLANYRHVTLRAGEPVDVRAFLEHADTTRKKTTDGALVRQLTYTLLRRLERERRAVVGPRKKPADRVRDEVVRSPRLQRVIAEMAGPGKHEQRVLTWRALGIVREMESALDMNAVAAIDAAADRMLGRMFSSIEVDAEGIDRVRRASKDETLIFLPSHKSHIDYIVLAYILYHRRIPLPVIAAGDNLSFFPLGPILRRAGAFFIRRSFRGDRLYGAVVDAYMRRIILDGHSLEFFLEGGRSRTGKLLPPKVGLLSVVVDAAIATRDQPLRFVPVSIGYERVVEEQSYIDESSGREKRKEDVRGLLAGAETVRGRYGRVNVQFGELLSLDDVLSELGSGQDLANLSPPRRRALITRLAYRIMNEINRVTAVTPGALVATALLVHEQPGIEYEALLQSCRRLGKILARFGARFSPSLASSSGEVGAIRDGAIREAVELFVRAGNIDVRIPGKKIAQRERLRAARRDPSATFVVPDERRISLDIAKNVVIHFFVSRATVAVALRSSPTEETTESELRDRVQELSRLLKYEYQFRANASFDEIFRETITTMLADGELEWAAGGIRIASSSDGERVHLYAATIRHVIEGYRVAARGLQLLLKQPLSSRDFAKRTLPIGERMFLAGEIARREAVSRFLIENAVSAFADQGYLSRQKDALSLAPSYGSMDTVKIVEAKIARFSPVDRPPPS